MNAVDRLSRRRRQRPAHARRCEFGGATLSEARGGEPVDSLDEAQKRFSAALMRVNHVGRSAPRRCTTPRPRRPAIRPCAPTSSARDETDHLAWTSSRLRELGGRTSLLNPLWYAGAFGIGWVAGRTSDALSSGLRRRDRAPGRAPPGRAPRTPAGPDATRAIVEQMREDEALHADQAQQAGAMALPAPVRWLMRTAAKVMTRTAHHV